MKMFLALKSEPGKETLSLVLDSWSCGCAVWNSCHHLATMKATRLWIKQIQLGTGRQRESLRD
jgi:hypothetical protein